jgi:quercetin 2,3-dioxygenase
MAAAASSSAAAPALRVVARAIPAREVVDGAGVLLRRTVGSAQLPHHDPFLMLDHLTSTRAAAAAGFPTHPHRGQTTVSVMLRGGMRHEDSMGNVGVVKAGGVQVMRAGDGVLHSEFPTAPDDDDGDKEQMEEMDEDEEAFEGGVAPRAAAEIEGFQLWVNLPSARKRQPPAYQDVQAADIPRVALAGGGGVGGGGGAGATARVLAGALGSAMGPARLAPPEVLLLDVRVPKGARAEIPVDARFAGFCYVYRSSAGAKVGGAPALAKHALVLTEPAGAGDDDDPAPQPTSVLQAEAGPCGGLRLLLAAGRPIGEPVVQHGPFVMNTRAEIEQAFADYRAGTLVKGGAARGFDPFEGGGRGELRDEEEEKGPF